MSSPHRIPDFFIIGAPKCGTTALYSYLDVHPATFMSPVKEPHHFTVDFYMSAAPNARVGGFTRRDHYTRLFANARHDQLCGEGSTLYLLSRVAVAEILKANPRAKLIAMVRNPLDMVVSFHRQNLYDFIDTELDFAVAWQSSTERACGKNIPRSCRTPVKLNYKSIGRLGEQIDRLLRVAPRQQVHVIVFDDFVADTLGSYRETLKFLGIYESETTEFPVVNAHKERRFPWVSKLLMQPPFPLRQFKSILVEHFPAQVRRMGRPIHHLNTRPTTKPAVSAEIRREMAREFAEDIELLGCLLGRNLSHWYKNAL